MDSTYQHLPGRSLLTITGDDTIPFLQGLITRDINAVTEEKAVYGAILTPQGKVISDFFIALYEDQYFVDVPTSQKEVILTLLKRYKLRSQVEIVDVSDHYFVYSLQGDLLFERVETTELGTAKSFCSGIAFIDPRHAAIGGRCFHRNDKEINFEEVGFAKGSVDTYEKKRIELAIPEVPTDIIPEKSFPLVVGLKELHAIDFDKGCYVGQEVTIRTEHRGNTRKGFYQITANDESALPSPGSPVICADKNIGEITSSLGNQGIALLNEDAASQTKESFHADHNSITIALPSWRQ